MEQQAPVLDCGVYREGFLAGGAGEEESLFVDAFEELGVGGEEAAERGGDGLLFGEGVGAVGY